MAVTDVTMLVERLEAFEERLGVRLESLGAQLNPLLDDLVHLEIRGEMHPQAGTELQQDVKLVVAAYDANGRIVGTDSHLFEAGGFFGFETFEIIVQIYVNKLTRVRVYPKRND
ncbi:MAG: hypothetical protein IT447_09760 [Phycisphaerales bacterium]|jgi:hypothetical protein|nr:hypothetical protein [Phycisphaerales bacterium]